jgi:hypothetical protein
MSRKSRIAAEVVAEGFQLEEPVWVIDNRKPTPGRVQRFHGKMVYVTLPNGGVKPYPPEKITRDTDHQKWDEAWKQKAESSKPATFATEEEAKDWVKTSQVKHPGMKGRWGYQPSSNGTYFIGTYSAPKYSK